MPAPALTLSVVGADYPNKSGPARRFEIALCNPGEIVDLVPEPRNPADRNAIAVFSQRGVKIGYVTAERAPWIGKQMRSTLVSAVFQGAAPHGALIRVAFGGEKPILPHSRHDPSSPEADGFFPDEIYPDE